MKHTTKEYIELFEKTLNFNGICWWIIDFKENPDSFYCNNSMKETFSLDKTLQFHSIEKTCPIAGDYNKNIELACKTYNHAQTIIDEYKQLLNREIDEYSNKFPYFSEEFNKTLYFTSRAKILEVDDKNKISILYGIIIDITTQEEQKQEIEKLLNIDKLTGINNRNKLDESLNIEIEKVQRYDTKLSLIIADIDKFKLVNDNYGHLVGDEVLIQVSKLLKENSRITDIVGRWGGEEFMIICSNSTSDDATKLAQKLRQIIKNFHFDIVGGVTLSFGITQFNQKDTEDQFITRADQALYLAKDTGRDRVEEL